MTRASISRDFQIATSEEVLLTISSDSSAAVLAGAEAYVDALRSRWSEDVGGEAARLAADIEVRVSTLTERIDELESQLGGVPVGTDVFSQVLAADRLQLSSERERSRAALAELARYAEHSPELVVVSQVPESKASGSAQSSALGLIGGALLGLTLAAIWARLDRRVRSARDVELACDVASVVAGSGRRGVLSERDCAAAAAIAARPVLDGIADSVEIVVWEPEQHLTAKLRDQLQLAGVTTVSPPSLSESAAAFVEARGASAIIVVVPGRVEQRALADVVRRLHQAGAVQVGVLLGSFVGVEHEHNAPPV